MQIRLLFSLFSLLWMPPQARIPGPGGSGGGAVVVSGASPSVVAHVLVVGGSTSPLPVNTTGATLLVGFVQDDYGTLPTISDSAGNTWTAGTVDSGQSGSGIYYCLNPRTSSSHTFSLSTAGSAIAVIAFSGSITGFDAGAHTTSGTGGGDPTITPSQAGELFVTAFATLEYAGTAEVGSGFAITDQSAAGGLADAWLVNASSSGISPAWTVGAGYAWFSGLVAFKTH